MEKLVERVQTREGESSSEVREEKVKRVQTIKEKLDRLGFKNAVKTMDRVERMKLAYERYMFITPDKVKKFNDKLYKESLEVNKSGYGQYKTLIFTKIEDYGQIPPDSVLDKLERATSERIFDWFEVGHITSKKVVPDPIVFGRIDKCEDRFFVAQWDDDVKIEDLIFER